MSAQDTLHPAGFPFLYNELVNRLPAHPQRLFLIQGGTGMGKTEVLKKFAKSRGEEENLVQGRLGARSVTHLIKLAGLDLPPEETEAMEPRAIYCIDDLDALLGAHRQPDHWLIDKTEQAISVLKKMAEECDALLIATTTALPHRLLTGSNADVWSNILQSFKKESLDPWPPTWEKLRRDELEEYFGKLPGKVLDLWTRQILEMSGGHPALLGVCFGELQRLIDLKSSSREATATERGLELLEEVDRAETSGQHSLEDRLRLHLEDLLNRRALPTISRALRRLQQSSERDDQDGFDYLQKLAERPEADSPENPEPFIASFSTLLGLRTSDRPRLRVTGERPSVSATRVSALTGSHASSRPAADAGSLASGGHGTISRWNGPANARKTAVRCPGRCASAGAG